MIYKGSSKQILLQAHSSKANIVINILVPTGMERLKQKKYSQPRLREQSRHQIEFWLIINQYIDQKCTNPYTGMYRVPLAVVGQDLPASVSPNGAWLSMTSELPLFKG